MNDLNKLYKAILEAMGSVIKPTGEIMFSLGGKEYPITVNGMQLYLPTSEILEGNTIDKVFFHPACEHILSKETEVFKIVRKMSAMSLLNQFSTIVPIILKVSKGTPKKSWKQNVLDLITPLKSITQARNKEIQSLCSKITPEVPNEGPDLRFVHFKVTKGGGRSTSLNERVYYKTVPSFPFYNELIKRLARSEGQPDNTLIELGGDSYSRGAINALSHIFQYALPAVLNPDDCVSESVKPTAARLVSYLTNYVELAEELNRAINTFRVEFNKEGIYPLEVNWVEDFDNIEDIYTQIPMLDYNGHNTQEETVVTTNHLNDDFFNVGNVNNNNNNVVVNNGMGNNNTQYSHTVNPSYTGVGDVSGFDTTVPQLQPGDQFIKTEVCYASGRVYHHCVNRVTGMPVRYVMTRHGNLLMREENSQSNNNMMGMNMLAMLDPNMAQQAMLQQQMNSMGAGLNPLQMAMMELQRRNPATSGGSMGDNSLQSYGSDNSFGGPSF